MFLAHSFNINNPIPLKNSNVPNQPVKKFVGPGPMFVKQANNNPYRLIIIPIILVNIFIYLNLSKI